MTANKIVRLNDGYAIMGLCDGEWKNLGEFKRRARAELLLEDMEDIKTA